MLGDVRLAEMFVPYHSGSPRFWDVSYNFDMVTMTAAEAGPFGKLLGDPPDGGAGDSRSRPHVDGRRQQAGAARAKTGALGALNAANYRYVIEFSFHDDGTRRLPGRLHRT